VPLGSKTRLRASLAFPAQDLDAIGGCLEDQRLFLPFGIEQRGLKLSDAVGIGPAHQSQHIIDLRHDIVKSPP